MVSLRLIDKPHSAPAVHDAAGFAIRDLCPVLCPTRLPGQDGAGRQRRSVPLPRQTAQGYVAAMMTRILALVLALCLSLTSVTAAVAHVQEGGAQQVVLCGTPGVDQVITLDAFGNPVVTDHHCPDCLGAASILTSGQKLLPRPLTRGEDVPPIPAGPRLSAEAPSPSARGPPAAI